MDSKKPGIASGLFHLILFISLRKDAEASCHYPD